MLSHCLRTDMAPDPSSEKFEDSKIEPPRRKFRTSRMSRHCRYSVKVNISGINRFLQDSNSLKMCWVENQFHLECGHWGRVCNTQPCIRAIGSAPCSDKQPLGVMNVQGKCPICRYREQSGGWIPLENVSNTRVQGIGEQSPRRRPWWSELLGGRYLALPEILRGRLFRRHAPQQR